MTVHFNAKCPAQYRSVSVLFTLDLTLDRPLMNGQFGPDYTFESLFSHTRCYDKTLINSSQLELHDVTYI